MKRFAGRNIYVLIAIPILLVLVLSKWVVPKEINSQAESNRIYKLFSEKEHRLKLLMDSIALNIGNKSQLASDWSLLRLFQKTSDGLEVVVEDDKSLVFWSSASVAFPVELKSHAKSRGLIRLPTGWYFKVTQRTGIFTINGLILIKREFPYHNRYIKSSFEHRFNIRDDFDVRTTPNSDGLNVLQPDGQFLFSLYSSDNSFQPVYKSDFLAILSFIFILLVLTQFNFWLKNTKGLSGPLKFIISLGIAFFIYLCSVIFKCPSLFYETNLFSPNNFAYHPGLDSLGEFLLLSILIFYVSRSDFLGNEVRISQKLNLYWKVFAFFFVAYYFSFSVALLKILLRNSNITLEFYRDFKFSAINFYAFIAIAFQVLGFVIMVWRLCKNYIQELGVFQFLILLFSTGAIAAISVSYLFEPLDWTPFIFYAFVILILTRFKTAKIREFKFSFLLILSVAAASYINFYVQHLIAGKSNEVLDLWGVKLSSERDSGAEIFLSELDSKLQKDSNIQSHLIPPYKTLESYLQNNYFNGFWRNYNLQITVCNSKDSVYITDEKRHYPCADFFNNLRESKGVLVTGSNFYFMDRVNGRITYLGQLDVLNSIKIPVEIFIELTSKPIPDGKGYPELLLEGRAARESQVGDFSYAKYFDGELVDRGGDYQYNMKLSEDIPMNAEFTHFSQNGYRHSAYHRNGNNYVIVSSPEIQIYDRISTFPYLFLLFFLMGASVLLFNDKTLKIMQRKLDFREKIQLTLILSLLGILSIIGIGLMVYNSTKLLHSVKDNLNDKLMSVASELSMRMGQDTILNAPMLDFMNEQLVVLSDIIRADINLYGLNGQLFATSRSEIYERGLMSRRIDPIAFRAISVDHKTLFLHDENLGEMNFFSAYSPIYNQNNRLMGYLNLPYFTGQDDFEKQVSDFIVAFSNLYILLIMISLIVALIISYKLTKPLLQIENYLKGIQLGKTNAKIEYTGDDEIGRLAKEYNKKVDELAESAELLARSERESAWQEMARQVAHEINNPLTPMKLSIQYLQRIKEQNAENFDDYFFRVSKTLVEQIDALSMIASSFSDFAKMPMVNDELIDLRDKIKEVILLFENVSNVDVSFQALSEEPITVMADKDQLGRAVINLVKNGIQAIRRDRQGILKVSVYKDHSHAYISIADNGIGIPIELQEKLFEPSFTTKSSGMGLGLAITKKIVENFKGEIWFESTRNVETIFYIKLPLIDKI